MWQMVLILHLISTLSTFIAIIDVCCSADHAKPVVGSKVESHHKPASLPAEFKRSLMSLASASRSLVSYLLPSEDQSKPVFMPSQEGRHLTEAQAQWLASHQS
jgi:hypothetical protein